MEAWELGETGEEDDGRGAEEEDVDEGMVDESLGG